MIFDHTQYNYIKMNKPSIEMKNYKLTLSNIYQQEITNDRFFKRNARTYYPYSQKNKRFFNTVLDITCCPIKSDGKEKTNNIQMRFLYVERVKNSNK